VSERLAALRRVRVVAALIEDGDKLLIQQRPAKGERGELWEFPGGKREAGETDLLALARECREELGIEVAVGDLAWETEHVYPDLIVALALYRCKLVEGTPSPRDGQRIEWARREGLGEYPFCEADLPFLEILRRGESNIITRAEKPNRFRVGAYGVLIEVGKVLVTRTVTRSAILNNFPGGAVELGEGPLEALRRELREETGLEVRPLELLHATEGYHRSRDYPENQLVKLYWKVERIGGTLAMDGNGDDVASCLWVPLRDLAAAGLTDSDAEILPHLREYGVL
jgi:8-oxo-dGTP diphosphatase